VDRRTLGRPDFAWPLALALAPVWTMYEEPSTARPDERAPLYAADVARHTVHKAAVQSDSRFASPRLARQERTW